jgi:hypothetical protein
LLRRIEIDLTTKQNSPTQESTHAAATTGTVEHRASSDSTGLSTTHASTTEQSGRSAGPTHSQTGPGSSSSLNPTRTS